VPLIYLYLFGVWSGLIVLLALVLRTRAARGDSPTSPPHATAGNLDADR
jgi:hypothetical protein